MSEGQDPKPLIKIPSVTSNGEKIPSPNEYILKLQEENKAQAAEIKEVQAIAIEHAKDQSVVIVKLRTEIEKYNDLKALVIEYLDADEDATNIPVSVSMRDANNRRGIRTDAKYALIDTIKRDTE
tara:strand:+ start:852 stop:1226 length:375 start_codon:yes stop_codon:yes gene_type:complete